MPTQTTMGPGPRTPQPRPMSSQTPQRVPTPTAVQQVQQLLVQYKDQIAQALPKHLTADRLARICLTELRKTPMLQQCDALSFMGSVIVAATLGLEPGAALGQCYLIPRKNECTLLIGYRGMITLARRSGEILSISARAVYEGDDFHVQYGTQEQLTHVPRFKTSTLTHVYAVAQLKGGGTQFDLMGMDEIEYIRKTYSGDKNQAWKSSYDEMAKKTVIRRLFKLLPACVEIADAMALVDSEASQGNHQVIDASHEIKPAESDADKIMDNWKEPSDGESTRLALRTALEAEIDRYDQRGGTQETFKSLINGKTYVDWIPTASAEDIMLLTDRLKKLPLQ